MCKFDVGGLLNDKIKGTMVMILKYKDQLFKRLIKAFIL